jgi:hypothetical protein
MPDIPGVICAVGGNQCFFVWEQEFLCPVFVMNIQCLRHQMSCFKTFEKAAGWHQTQWSNGRRPGVMTVFWAKIFRVRKILTGD